MKRETCETCGTSETGQTRWETYLSTSRLSRLSRTSILRSRVETRTGRRVCRLSSPGRLLLRSFRSVVGWLLLVGVQFQLRHGMLQASPFFRNQGEKFDPEAALARPPHDGFKDGDGGFVLQNMHAYRERASRVHGRLGFHAAATQRQINHIALSTDHGDGGKGTVKPGGKPGMLPFIHVTLLLRSPLYIANRTQFRHFFCNSRTIDRLHHFRYILVCQASLLRQT